MNLLKRILNKNKKFGLLGKDPDDPRDLQLAELQPERVKLPSEFMEVVEKIQEIGIYARQFFGTCASEASVGQGEYENSKEYGRAIDLSTRYNHYNTKKISGLWTHEGDFLRNAVKARQKYGVCTKELWEGKRSMSWKEYIETEPSEKAKKQAEKHKVSSYWAVEPDRIKEALVKNKIPIVIGMMWYSNQLRIGKEGKLPLPTGNKIGGHAFRYIGYNRKGDWFLNSWGKNWGKNGMFYISRKDRKHYNFWNAWATLDEKIPEIPTVGWAAQEYLKFNERPRFEKGDKVEPTVHLRLRTHPTIYGHIVKVMTPKTKCEIIKEEARKVNGFTWRKIKIIK